MAGTTDPASCRAASRATPTRDRCVQAVRIRNDAVHGEALRRADVDRLLQAMREAIDRASEAAAPRG